MIKLLKTLFILFVFAAPSFGQTTLSQVRINDFSGGMNSNALEDILDNNVGASMVNVNISRPGRVSKRGGQGLFLKDVGSTGFRGIGRFDPDASTSYVVAASDDDIIAALLTDEEWRVANATSKLTAGFDTEFIQANDLLFVLNGSNNTSWWNGSQFLTGHGFDSASPPTAKYGAWLRNYLFLAGNPTNPDWVYFSNNLDPLAFTATDIIKINTGDGQAIQALQPFRINELIIYKERSIFVLDITGSTPLDDWTVQPISKVLGLIAPRSVVSLGNDQWFLSSNPIAVRSLVRSEFDKILLSRVSDPIQDMLDGSGKLRINEEQIDKAAAVLFDDKYLLALPTGDSTVNNTVVVFDFKVNGWYRIDGWFPAEWVVWDERLFYVDANDGRILECFTATFADFREGPEEASQPSVGIGFEYISKAIDFDVPESFKVLDALEVEFEPTGSYTASVLVNLDKNGWTSAGSVSLAGNSSTLPITLPTVLGNEGVARKTFQLQSEGEFKKIQFRVANGASNQNVILQRATVFGRIRPWRRE